MAEFQNMKTNLKIILSAFIILIIHLRSVQAQLYHPENTAAENKEVLYNFLKSVYGKKIISGQMDDKYLSYIVETTGGKSPAMMGYDFNGICPSQSGNNDAAKAINWVKKQGRNCTVSMALDFAQCRWRFLLVKF